VFQQFNLFPHLTVLENCALVLARLRGLKQSEANGRAMALLDRVGLANCAAPCSCMVGMKRMPDAGKRSEASMNAEPTIPKTSVT
jgi:ABC-type proline/glycine betaine transport system ATPase subunit